jgi:hypothetical protein
MLAAPASRRMVITRVAQAGHDPRSAGGADLRAVFAEVHVADPVQAVFDAPVAADDGGELSVAGLADGERGDRVAGLTRPLPLHLATARDLDGPGGVGEGQPAGGGGDLQGAPSVRPCPRSRAW